MSTHQLASTGINDWTEDLIVKGEKRQATNDNDKTPRI